jgi:arylformamidase
MRTALVTMLLLSLSSFGFGAEPVVRRNVAYTEPADAARRLDVYAPETGRDHPIAIWIHGGGWRRGDKVGVQDKPAAFVAKGYVFVSVNYRFVPDVTVAEQAGDIARAIRHVRDRAQEYGGAPDKIIVMGHSAGAHLAALVCTDETYLKAEGLKLSDVSACIPVDSAAFDVPAQIRMVLGPRLKMYNDVFGAAETQRAWSPITHVAKDKGTPPFLILHVADRRDARLQSEAFGKALKDAGVDVRVFAAEGKTHATINRELGLDGDKPTEAVFEFLEAVVK